MILLQKKQDLLRNMSIKSGIKSAEKEAELRRQRELEDKKLRAKQECERKIIEEQKRRLELEVSMKLTQNTVSRMEQEELELI